MGEILLFTESRQKSHFKIHYPYYGLFGSAEITPVENENLVYKCKLLNGTVMFVKKLLQPKKWIDASLNRETPLSSVIGNSIEDFLKTSK